MSTSSDPATILMLATVAVSGSISSRVSSKTTSPPLNWNPSKIPSFWP
jgi:hypothetical protein